MCEAWTQSELKFGKNGALGEKTRTFGPSENTKYRGIRTQDQGSQVVWDASSYWMELFSFTSWEYNCVFTHCYQSLCFTCLILAYSSKTLHQSSNKDSVSMRCLLLGYSLEPRLNSRALCTAGSSVMTISLSISVWNGCSHSEYQFDESKQDWQLQKFEVWWLHKA